MGFVLLGSVISIAFSIGSILVECWVVEESGVKVVFRALRRSGHYAVTNGTGLAGGSHGS
jgi:Na+/serine symporter